MKAACTVWAGAKDPKGSDLSAFLLGDSISSQSTGGGLSAGYFVRMWKMLRKKGCVPSALTQNVKDLLASREVENILENTDFMILLSQAQGDRKILAVQLGISEHQLSYIAHSNSGEGLLFYGNTTIPFVDRFPQNTEIYRLLTTRPEDIAKEAQNE